jgi:carboxypeptidase family protein/TonB-dependent receptor-like protein
VFPNILILITALLAPAQPETGRVDGRVVDSRGNEPLARVQVQLAGTPHRTVTDADGNFQLTGVPPGEYVLHVSTVGYHLLRQKFILAPGEVKSFEAVLTPSSYRRTDSVDVKAEPFDLARQESASALTLSGNEEKNLASVLADDPLRAVQSLPGVTSDNDFTSEFSLRGASFDRIGLFLDGVLLHSPFHMVEGQGNHGSLTIFNGDLLDEMTLYEGAWPVRYSDRTAGMLGVNTREGNRRQTQIRGSASVSNAGVLAEGPLGTGRRASWLVAFRKSYLQYLLNRVDFGSDEPSLAFGFTDGQAKLSFDLTPKHNLSLSILDGLSSLDRTRARARLGLNSAMTSGYRFTLLNLASRYTPGPRFLATNRLAWMRERGDVGNPNNSTLGRDAYGEWIGNTNATWIWGGANTFDFGGVVRRLRDDGYSWRYEFSPAASRPLDLFRGTGLRSGAYAQQSFALLAGRIHLAAGLRWDRHSVSSVDVTSPYASVALQPFAGTRIQFDWGQYAQFPELSQYFSIFGRPSLLPERAIHYEAAIDQRLDERTRVRLEFYNRQDRDLIARPEFDARLLANGRIFNPPINAPILNSQRGYARGAQIFLQRRTANGFTGWVSYAYGHAQVRDGDLRLSFPADFDQKHTVNVFGSYRLRPTVNLSVRWVYGSGFPIPGFYRAASGTYFLAPNRDGARVSAYQRTDVRVNKAFVYDKWNLTLFAEVVNLTNRTNRQFDSYNGFNSRTAQVNLSFFKMFPILPSVGILCER